MARNKHTRRTDRGARGSKRQRALTEFLKELVEMKRAFEKEKPQTQVAR